MAKIEEGKFVLGWRDRKFEKADFIELTCDVCETRLGWVRDFDLNESYFICGVCRGFLR